MILQTSILSFIVVMLVLYAKLASMYNQRKQKIEHSVLQCSNILSALCKRQRCTKTIAKLKQVYVLGNPKLNKIWCQNNQDKCQRDEYKEGYCEQSKIHINTSTNLVHNDQLNSKIEFCNKMQQLSISCDSMHKIQHCKIAIQPKIGRLGKQHDAKHSGLKDIWTGIQQQYDKLSVNVLAILKQVDYNWRHYRHVLYIIRVVRQLGNMHAIVRQMVKILASIVETDASARKQIYRKLSQNQEQRQFIQIVEKSLSSNNMQDITKSIRLIDGKLAGINSTKHQADKKQTQVADKQGKIYEINERWTQYRQQKGSGDQLQGKQVGYNRQEFKNNLNRLLQKAIYTRRIKQEQQKQQTQEDAHQQQKHGQSDQSEQKDANEEHKQKKQ